MHLRNILVPVLDRVTFQAAQNSRARIDVMPHFPMDGPMARVLAKRGHQLQMRG
jgi:hypothetical protein